MKVEIQSFGSGCWDGVRRHLHRVTSRDEPQTDRFRLQALACSANLGVAVPSPLAAKARIARIISLTAPALLKRVRDCCDGPIILLKGPETAAYYPQPQLRLFGDVDILVPDAVNVQRSLIATGFRPIGGERRFLGGHHLPPLLHRSFPLLVEVHSRPHWVEAISSPAIEEFFESAVKSIVAVPGILALPRVHHTVILAVHAWAHSPLGSLSHLIDIAAARDTTSARDIDELATAWKVDRLWRTTAGTIDALFLGSRSPWPLRIWASHLGNAREMTVLENHLQRWLAGFSALPIRQAARLAVRAMLADVRPRSDEDWQTKFRRTQRALKNAFVRRSQHDEEGQHASDEGSFTGVSDVEDRR